MFGVLLTIVLCAEPGAPVASTQDLSARIEAGLRSQRTDDRVKAIVALSRWNTRASRARTTRRSLEQRARLFRLAAELLERNPPSSVIAQGPEMVKAWENDVRDSNERFRKFAEELDTQARSVGR